MSTQGLAFRRCEAADQARAVPLMHSAGPDQYNYVFCDSAADQSMRFLHGAFAGTRSEFSHRQHHVGVVDGTVVACGGLRFSSQNPGFTLAAAARMLSFYGPLAGVRTMARGLRAERILVPPTRGVGILYNLGVAPGFQGRGIGSGLVRHLVSRLRQAGLTVAELDVAETNVGARRLYERLGFVPVDVRRGPARSRFGQIVPHTRMRLTLPRLGGDPSAGDPSILGRRS